MILFFSVVTFWFQGKQKYTLSCTVCFYFGGTTGFCSGYRDYKNAVINMIEETSTKNILTIIKSDKKPKFNLVSKVFKFPWSAVFLGKYRSLAREKA